MGKKIVDWIFFSSLLLSSHVFLKIFHDSLFTFIPSHGFNDDNVVDDDDVDDNGFITRMEWKILLQKKKDKTRNDSKNNDNDNGCDKYA